MEMEKQNFIYNIFKKNSLTTVITVYLTLVGFLFLTFSFLLTISLVQPTTYSTVSSILCSTGIVISLTLPLFLIERFITEKKLRRQNEQLFKYAHLNSHEVRGPVARILGLIEVTRLDKDSDYLDFFEKVKSETKDIDKILRTITVELNKIEELGHLKILKKDRTNI